MIRRSLYAMKPEAAGAGTLQKSSLWGRRPLSPVGDVSKPVYARQQKMQAGALIKFAVDEHLAS